MSNITIYCGHDKQYVTVEYEKIKLCKTIENILCDLPNDDDQIVPLPEVESDVLAKVVEFCDNYVPSVPDEKKNTDLSKFTTWEQEFLNIDQALFLKLLLTSNRLDCQPLLMLCSRHMAKEIAGKTEREICEHYRVKQRSLTDEERKQIEKENEWRYVDEQENDSRHQDEQSALKVTDDNDSV